MNINRQKRNKQEECTWYTTLVHNEKDKILLFFPLIFDSFGDIELFYVMPEQKNLPIRNLYCQSKIDG